MSVRVETAEAAAGGRPCWCCGVSFAADELVQLGSHPEVDLCAGCARWVARRAAEQAARRRGGLGARYRSTFARSRAWVRQRELQGVPVLGRLLRRLDRLLP